MQTITTIGLDIAKSVFQAHGVDAAGEVVIRRQNSHQSPLDVLAAQDAPRGLGEIECPYSRIVGRCLAMPTSAMGQSRRPDRALITSGIPG